MATSCAPIKAWRSWDWAPRPLSTSRRCSYSARSHPQTGGRRPRRSPVTASRSAVRPQASRARVLRRPAHRTDAEGDAQQLRLRHRHRCPNGTPSTRRWTATSGSVDPDERVAAVGVTAAPSRVLAYPPGRRERQRVRADRTVVGRVQALWEHVHSPRCATASTSTAAAGRSRAVTSTRRGCRSSSFAPRLVDRDLDVRDPGTVELVVEAYDETPIAVPAAGAASPSRPRPALARDARRRQRRAGLADGDRHGSRSPTTASSRRGTPAGRARTSRTASAATGSSSRRPGTRGRSPTAATSSRSPPPTSPATRPLRGSVEIANAARASDAAGDEPRSWTSSGLRR